MSIKNSHIRRLFSKEENHTMTIQEYTQDTVTQIVNAICEINKQVNKHGAFIAATDILEANSNSITSMLGATDENGDEHLITNIEFDIATTVSESKGNERGAGIKVNVLNLGINTRKEAQSQTLNRVKFSIPLAIPLPK